jgi:hypothetical protein
MTDFLTEIRYEFERLEIEPPNGRRLRSALPLGAVAATLLCVGAAGAATGLIGTVVPDGEKDAHAGAGQQYVVATGASPVAGPWELSSLHHEAEDGAGPGDCLKLELTSPPPGAGILGTLLCQKEGEADFEADAIPVVSAVTGEAETLVFGAAPKGASNVVVRGASVRAELRAASHSPGDVWIVALPSATKDAEISWIQDGKTRDTLDASRFMEQLHIWERNVLEGG